MNYLLNVYVFVYVLRCVRVALTRRQVECMYVCMNECMHVTAGEEVSAQVHRAAQAIRSGVALLRRGIELVPHQVYFAQYVCTCIRLCVCMCVYLCMNPLHMYKIALHTYIYVHARRVSESSDPAEERPADLQWRREGDLLQQYTARSDSQGGNFSIGKCIHIYIHTYTT